MSATEGFFVLDSENSPVGDKRKLEKVAKGFFGSVARKRLGDISNMPHQLKPLIQPNREQFVPNTTKEYIDQLQKENMTLMKLLSDRNKIIELSGTELHKLRVNLQKLQQQNLQLVQANSQMLVELNSGKDRLKALHHELGCKNGLLIAKKMELEVRTSKPEEAKETSEAGRAENKPCSTNRKQQSKSLGPSTIKQVQSKEKIENKRVCLRRQSARFKSEEPAPTEDTFEIDNTQFPVCSLHDDQIREEGSTSMCSSVKKDDKKGSTGPSDEAQELRRPSIGRPLRLASKKVQSYKETPLNVKMRRPA